MEVGSNLKELHQAHKLDLAIEEVRKHMLLTSDIETSEDIGYCEGIKMALDVMERIKNES